MLFRLILLLAVVGGLTVFTLQNLTPLLPLVFFGIQFPALPVSWWVLGAIAAGAASMLAIQVLLGVSNFVVGQSVKSKVRKSSRVDGESRWSTSTATTGSGSTSRGSSRRDRSTSEDDSSWQDWRGYESSASNSSSRSTSSPVDDWERPPSDDWEAPQDSRSRVSDRVAPEDLRSYEANTPPKRSSRSGSSYSYSYREPQDSPVERSGVERTEPAKKSEPVVDADFRVIVPPYNPLDELIPPPPPPPVEENADDWFEDGTSDEFGDPQPKSP